MLTWVPILTALLFAVLYPTLHLLISDVQMKSTFYQFNWGMAALCGTFALVGSFWLRLPYVYTGAGIFWLVLLLGGAFRGWENPYGNKGRSIISLLPGLIWLVGLLNYCLPGVPWAIACSLMAGFVFCLSIFSTTLGHWYLEMKDLPMKYLMRVCKLMALCLGMRLVLFIGQSGWGTVLTLDGDLIPMNQFLMSLDGFFVWVAVLFGVLLPLIFLFMVKKTLEAGSNTSATGILYVILIAVFIGDIAFKFLWAQYGVWL